jgi:photosystem II stability/assembly factor-like uncharacterized protein
MRITYLIKYFWKLAVLFISNLIITAYLISQEIGTSLWNPTTNTFLLQPVTSKPLFLSVKSTESWQSLGPDQNDILGLAFGDEEGDILIAASRDSGVFMSFNGGNYWQRVNQGIDDSFIRAIEAHPVNRDHYFAGTFNQGLFQKQFDDDRWVRIPEVQDNTILCIAINPIYGEFIYVGTLNKGVYRSINTGTSWQQVTHETDALKVIVDPLNTNQVYFISENDSTVYKSTDFGFSWESFYKGYPIIISMAVNPLNSNVIYAGKNPYDFIYKSIDGGASWKPIAIMGGQPIVSDILIDPSDTSQVYVATPGWGVFRTTDSGNSWIKMWEGLTSELVLQIRFLPAASSTLFAATNNDGIFKVEIPPAGIFEPDPATIPYGCKLFQNIPNPFNPKTKINFQLKEKTFITVSVYNICGKLIKILVNEIVEQGFHEIEWNGRNMEEKPVSSGIYFVRLETDLSIQTRKMILAR